jgi:CRP/FNR family transcriptional regulator, cyclic AMP receptor protein
MSQSARLSQAIAKIFPTLSISERQTLITTMQKASFPAGTKIFNQGEQGDSLYAIVEGSVQIRYRLEGAASGETLLASLGAGSLFGEMCVFGDHLRSASAVCATTVTLYRFSREDLAKQPPEILLKLYQSLAEILTHRLANLNKRFVELVAFSDGLTDGGERPLPVGEMQKRIFAELIGLDSEHDH